MCALRRQDFALIAPGSPPSRLLSTSNLVMIMKAPKHGSDQENQSIVCVLTIHRVFHKLKMLSHVSMSISGVFEGTSQSPICFPQLTCCGFLIGNKSVSFWYCLKRRKRRAIGVLVSSKELSSQSLQTQSFTRHCPFQPSEPRFHCTLPRPGPWNWPTGSGLGC